MVVELVQGIDLKVVTSIILRSEGVALVLSDLVGTVVGLLATGLMLFYLPSFQRFAGIVADAALPKVVDSEDYRQFRKYEVYGEAFLSSTTEGMPSPVARAALNSR